MSSTQTGFLDSLMSAIRENPLSAALIGGGALWLLVGNEKLKNAANSAAAAVSPGADVVTPATSRLRRTVAPPTAPEMDHDGSFRVGEGLRQAKDAASDGLSGAADRIKRRFDDGVAYARDNISNLSNPLPKDAFTRAQSSLGEMLERQPLVLGVIGLAIGAAVAGALQASDLENEWVGEFSDDVKAELSTRAGAVSERLHEASDTVKSEFNDTAEEAVDRLKQAGMDAADAAREKARSS